MCNACSRRKGKIQREKSHQVISHRWIDDREIRYENVKWMELIQDESAVVNICRYCDEPLNSIRMGIS
jgi:hypothetical protein